MTYLAKFPRIACAIPMMAILLGVAPAMADDPPGRVGRLSYLEGTVSFHAADANDWTLATVNYPVTSGNSLWTDANGRSEIQFGAVEVRMDNMTEMNIVELDDNTTRLEVPQGTVNVHVGAVPIGGSVQVMTPTGPIGITQPGTYHIDSGHPIGDQPSTQTLVTTLEGQLQISGPASIAEVIPGETAILNGNPPNFTLQEGNATPFDNWALMLEKREAAPPQPVPYVSPYMTGSEDLVRYGQWTTVPSYGPVWYPSTVVAGWAPYRYGHWAFVAPWGWTWVDDAPWGFAPFHYGRWAEIDGRWGWAPGTVVERPVYAPALVAFIGGAGWNVSLSIGGQGPGIGWVPLAPHEVFHPYYPVSVNYARNVNVAYVDKTVINNITVNNYKTVTVNNYANQRAATVVGADSFTHGAPVHRSMVTVSAQELARAPVTPTVTHLTPAPALREGGAALPEKAHEDLPHGNPPGMMHPESNPAAVSPHPQPMQPHPEGAMPQPQGQPAVPRPQVMTPNAAPGPEHREAQQAAPATFHAPTPPPHHATMPSWSNEAQQHNAPAAPHPAAAAQPLPKVPHPQQTTRIAPTPQGWQRTPVHTDAHPPGAPNEQRKPGEEQHPGQ